MLDHCPFIANQLLPSCHLSQQLFLLNTQKNLKKLHVTAIPYFNFHLYGVYLHYNKFT
jgi:hypothetical protein